MQSSKQATTFAKGIHTVRGQLLWQQDSNVSPGPQYTCQIARRVGRPGSLLGKGGGTEGESVCSHRETITQVQEQLCKAKPETEVLFRVIDKMKAQK